MKNITTNLVANVLSFITSFSISFLLTPYIIKTVSAEAYGFVSLGTNLMSYIAFFTYSLNLIAQRYVTVYIHQNDLQSANKYFSSVFILNVFITGILTIPTSLVIAYLDNFINISSNLVSDVKLLFMFIFIDFMFVVLSSSFSVSTYASNKIYLSALRNIEGIIIKCILLVVLFAFFSTKIFYIGVAALIATLYNLLWNIHYMKTLLSEIQIAICLFKLRVVRELIISGFWNMIIKIGDILLDGLDILIANILINSTVMGTLAIAKTVPGMILTLVFLLSQAYLPVITITYAKKNTDEIKIILAQCIKIIGFLVNILLVILFVFGDSFYKLWIPTQDEKVLQVLSMLIAINLLVRGPANILSQCFLVVNKLKSQAYGVVLSGVISITIIFMLIKLTNIGVYAIAGVSSIVIIIRELVFTLPYATKCLNINWNAFYSVVMKNGLSFFITLIIVYPLRIFFQIDNWISLVTFVGVGVFIALGVGFLIVFSKEEKKNVLDLVKNKLLKVSIPIIK